MKPDCQILVEAYTDTLYRLALSYCQNPMDAEDVVQEVFIKYLRRREPFRDEAHCRAWLCKVTVNQCRDLLRSPWHSRRCPLEEAAEPQTLLPEESALLSAVGALPAKYRLVVHLYYYEDYSIREIAEIAGASESAVRMRLLRARQKLKDTLGGIWLDE